jgi:hypothetical protein
MSVLLCLLSFGMCFMAGRRSLVSGLVAVFGVGYFYGITRANVPETFSHFIFDAGVVGLYTAQLFRQLSPSQEFQIRSLRPWLELLIVWPLLLFALPTQDLLIRLVGLRGSIFLLPFLLLGSRLDSDERYRLALCIAILNLMAFAFAGAEFFLGLEKFFPHNQMTKLIYASNDVGMQTAYRIPSSFANAHAYGGTMVVTLPFLLGALVQERRRSWHIQLFAMGLVAAIFGILMSASRTHFVVASFVIIVTTFSLRSRLGFVLGWIILVGAVGWVVSGEERLQRFTQLGDTSMVSDRIAGSVNMNILEIAAKYPFGNGLGGGGTSIPYFLQDRVENPIFIENEYARIMLEQGILGLIIWIAFILWVLTRRDENRLDSWYLGRRLARLVCAAFCMAAVTGTGMLTAVPQTCLFLLLAGWVAARQPVTAEQPLAHAQRGIRREAPVPARQYG